MNKRKMILGLIVGLVFVLAVGVTYAWFSATLSVEGGSSYINTELGTLNVEYTDGPQIVAENIHPGWNATKTLTVENIGTLAANYSIDWLSINNTVEREELVMSATCTGTGCRVINERSIGVSAGIIEDNIVIAPETTHTYVFTFTLKETSSIQNYNQGKSFAGVLNINGSDETAPVANPTLTQKMLEDNSELSDVSIDLSSDSNNSYLDPETWEPVEGTHNSNGQGLYYTNDLTKTEGGEVVYYYRGQVENNYVIFAGYCWRIVRTNEDGSVKLRYGGTPTGNVCPQTGTNVSLSFENDSFGGINSSKYAGYMYGNSCTNPELSTSNCYNNDASSIVKTYIDSWYRDNIVTLGSNITSKIADSPFCYDRSISSELDGRIFFSGLHRLIDTESSWDWMSNENASPQYKCNRSLDKFTVSNSSGNSALTYPVGLLSVDEAAYAGLMPFLPNTINYLNSDIWYWLGTPISYDEPYPRIYIVSSDGRINFENTETEGVKTLPVISLISSAGVETGNGEYNNPYIIEN